LSESGREPSRGRRKPSRRPRGRRPPPGDRGPGWAVFFTVVFLVLIGVGTGLRLWTSQQQQRESHRLALRWSAAEVNALAFRVLNELGRAERVLRTLAHWPRMTEAESDALACASDMAAFLPGFESFSLVYAGRADGSSFGAQRLLSGRIEVFTRQSPRAPAKLWAFGEGGGLAPKRQQDPVPFDPRAARWFNSAKASPGIVWSQPYAGTGASSIVTASLAHGDVVFGIDVSLAGIAEVLSGGRAGTPRSSIFILDRDYNPITGLARSVSGGHEAALDLFLRSGPAELDALSATAPTVRSFDTGRERFVGAIRSLRLSDEMLGAVVLLTPEEDVAPRVELSLLMRIGFGFIVAGLCAGVAAMASLTVGLSRTLASDRRPEPAEASESGEGGASVEAEDGDWPPMPQHVVGCVRGGGLDDAAGPLSSLAQRDGIETVGRMPDRLVLRASGDAARDALIDACLAAADDGA